MDTLLSLIRQNRASDWERIAQLFEHVLPDLTEDQYTTLHNALAQSIHGETYYRDYC